MQIQVAQKKKVKLKVGMSGASGFGKTYSALLLAFGAMKELHPNLSDDECWSKIVVIDTENESASLYADLGPYNVINLEPPYSPERYIEAIDAVLAAGMELVVIDSITHEWDGSGGCLDIQSSLGGRYQDWVKVTPRHQAFINKILQSPIHVITTVRRKQDYEMTKDSMGKLQVQKAGTKEITRDGFEYELTLNFEFINDNHMVKASKDRTGIYMNEPDFVITTETGKKLIQWANSGIDEKQIVINLIKSAKSREDLEAVAAKYPNVASLPDVLKELQEMGKKYPKQQ